MANCKNRCTSILTASGTSSCSDYVDHCCQTRCNNTWCNQCEFINDRTFTTLRKICHKIFKDYNRSQCREKYTIFDGGNSINVRIHRSGSCGDENRKHQKYEQPFKEDRYRLQNKYNNINGQDGRGGKIAGDENGKDEKYEQISSEDRYRLQNKPNTIMGHDGRGGKIIGMKPGRDGENFDSNVVVSNRDQAKRSKSKNAGEDVKVNDVDDKRNKKLESTKRVEGKGNSYDEQHYKETTLTGKQKFSKRINTKRNRNAEHVIEDKTIENQRSDSKKIDDENAHAKRGQFLNDSKRGLRDDNASVENYNGREKLSSLNGKIYEKMSRQQLKNAEMAKTKNRKVKNKYSVDIVDAVISSDDEVVIKRKYLKGKNLKDITAKNSNKSKNQKSNKHRKSQGFDDIGKSKEKNYHIITNLRNKVRRAGNVGPNTAASFSHIRKLLQKPESYQYRQTKPSRVDEVRACDYLRAFMEQRELCQCQCSQQSSQLSPLICIPQTYVPNCCPKTHIP